LSRTPPPSDTITVSAAVAERADGRLLVTRRLAGTHLAGLWEFPGGKCEPGETHEACLHREIREELGVDVTIRGLLLSTRHQYETRGVELHFFACVLADEPHPLLGQEIRWVTRAELAQLEFPEADAELIARLSASASSA
jgi:mutator protein MutT